jgi:3-hydroxyacyl-CoA dehydrogenase
MLTFQAIEVMGNTDTPQKTIDLVMEQCRMHGFQPFEVKRESTGYIYNRFVLYPEEATSSMAAADRCRIWAAIKREALLEVSEGVATAAEVDAIFKEVLKTPKGPCEQMDVVGLDVVLAIEVG